MLKKIPKFEALVVNAIRRLQAIQGSTESEIAHYLNQEYDATGPNVRKNIQLTLKRGINYGILQKSKRGYITCDRNIPEPIGTVNCCRCGKNYRRSRSKKRKMRFTRGHGKSRSKRAISRRVRKVRVAKRSTARKVKKQHTNSYPSKEKSQGEGSVFPTNQRTDSRQRSKSPINHGNENN